MAKTKTFTRTHRERMAFRKEFRRKMVSLLNEYIEESEHQDGYAYWDLFGSIEDAAKDFALAVKILAMDGFLPDGFPKR